MSTYYRLRRTRVVTTRYDEYLDVRATSPAQAVKLAKDGPWWPHLPVPTDETITDHGVELRTTAFGEPDAAAEGR